MRFILTALLLLALTGACGPAEGGRGGVPPWPDSLPPASAIGARRGLTPIRAAIHLHSVWSHDACDRKPVDEAGRPDEACLARLRRAICLQRIDAVFMTEHDGRIGDADSLWQILSFRNGDTRIEVDGRLVAKRQPCGEGRSAIWFAGAENAYMPIAVDSVPPGDVEQRRAIWNLETPGAADVFRALGAIVLLPHLEELDVATVAARDPDGIEVYNPHANFAPRHRESQGMSRLGAYYNLLPFYARWTRAHPDLALLIIFRANRPAIDTWDALLARRMVFGFGASDAHENALPWTLSDGERGDAYERLVAWVTNVVLVDRPDAVAAGDVGSIEDAVRRGRFFVAIEAWGTPVGFDFRLEGPGGVAEMGDTVTEEDGLTLVVEPPRVSLGGLDPAREPGLPEPEIRTRLYRVEPSGRRVMIAESGPASSGGALPPATLRVPVPGEGAYRVEVAIVPRHLEPYLGGAALMREVVWVYSNPIRVEAP